MDLALLVVRVVVGLVFVAHGSQKLFGAFGGGGIKGTAGMMDSLRLRPARLQAVAAATAEFTGGALLALGLLTPVGAALTTAVMFAAVATIHLQKGFWNHDGGYEYNTVLVAIVFALAGVGPGDWSLDNALGIDWASAGWAIAAFAAGAIAGIGAVIVGRLPARGEDRGTHPHPA